LDPCLDNPSEHLIFNETGEVVPLRGSELGRITIDILSLNREELVQARAQEAQKTDELFQLYLASSPTDNNALIPVAAALRTQCAADQPYAGTSRQLLNRWLKRDDVMNHPNAWILSNLLGTVTVEAPNSEHVESAGSRRGQLANFFQLVDTLESQIVHRAFLSVDIAGSTELKKGEHHLAVEYSFQKFRSLVDSIIEKHQALQYCWGGDGLMTSFDKSQNAVDAATEVIGSLRDFNRFENRLSKPFRARCGANSGGVRDDPSEDLERKTSPVIDLTGHLQKEARPDGLLISEVTLSEIENSADFHELDHEIDAQKIWEYGSGNATDY
jgi:class 3 adenylate cyclase